MELLESTITSNCSSASSDEIGGDSFSHDEDDQDEIIDVQYWHLHSKNSAV